MFNTTCPNFVRYRAKRAIATSHEGDYQRCFDRLQEWLKLFLEGNPGSIAVMETKELHDADGSTTTTFSRTIVIPYSLLPVVKAVGQRVVGLDGAHMKHDKYNGQLFFIVGRLGNGANLPFGIGFFEIENKDNWAWVLKTLHSTALGQWLHQAVLFSDRDKGLIPALAENLPDTATFNCFRHKVANIKAMAHREKWSTKSLGRNDELAWAPCKAPTRAKFDEAMTALRNVNPKAADYLLKEPLETWTIHANIEAGNALYGNATSNFVESENSRAKNNGLRNMPPDEALDRHVEQLLSIVADNAAALAQSSDVLTINATKHYEDVCLRVAHYTGTKNMDGTWYVKHQSQTSDRRHVNLQAKTCTCGMWFQLGMPCVHAVFAAMTAGVTKDDPVAFFNDYFDAVYRRSNVLDALLGVQIVLPDPETVESRSRLREPGEDSAPRIKPPPFAVKRGRPKKSRYKSRGEGLGGGGGGRAGGGRADGGRAGGGGRDDQALSQALLIPPTEQQRMMDVGMAAYAAATAAAMPVAVGQAGAVAQAPLAPPFPAVPAPRDARNRRREYTCSYCGATGHNKARCVQRKKNQ